MPIGLGNRVSGPRRSPRGRSQDSGPPVRHPYERLGQPVNSLRSTHARVAALVRHRGPDDPAAAAARAELAQSRDVSRALRALETLSAEDCAQLLATFRADLR